MALIRSGLFCGAFDCSSNNSVQTVSGLFRFPKENIYFKFGCLYKKEDERSGVPRAYLKSTE